MTQFVEKQQLSSWLMFCELLSLSRWNTCISYLSPVPDYGFLAVPGTNYLSIRRDWWQAGVHSLLVILEGFLIICNSSVKQVLEGCSCALGNSR